MPRASAILFLLFFLSGASALMFETLWQRMMVLSFGFQTSGVLRLAGPPSLDMSQTSTFSFRKYSSPSFSCSRRGQFWVQKWPLPATYLRYKEGATATIMVTQARDSLGARLERRFLVDGQVVASTHTRALVDSQMLAHIPLLLHPDPKRALTVGFGSGGTSWSMTVHNIETHCVEIEPEVPRSAYLFEMQNYGVLKSPRFKLFLKDIEKLRNTIQRWRLPLSGQRTVIGGWE